MIKKTVFGEEEMSVPAGQVQTNWRSCSKCQGMYFGRSPAQGVCPAGGEHDPSKSFRYNMLYDCQPAANVQTGWASCSKCLGMHFAGIAAPCPAGGQHDSINSFDYAMVWGETFPGWQDQFKACSKCQQLYYGPIGGSCPAGGMHIDTNSS